MSAQTPSGSYTTRLMASAPAGVDDPAGVEAGDLAVVAEAGGDVVHVILGLDQPFARIERLGKRIGGLVPLKEVRDAEHDGTSFDVREPAPRAVVERGPGTGDRPLRILDRR